MLNKKVNDKEASFEIISDYPWSDKVTIKYTGEEDVNMKLAVRIPGWCKDWKMNAPEDKQCTLENNYYYMEGNWKKGDTAELALSMEPRIISANSRVREDMGKVAVMRGPVVYCMEENDNSKDLHLYKICPDAEMKESTVIIDGQEFPVLIAKGMKQQEIEPDELYHEYKPASYEEKEIVLIPYYAWANRGENEMSVWIKAE